MESGSYLHKKFKNKVNVEPSSNPIQNEKENNSSLRANVSSTESSIFGNLYSKPNYVNKPTIEEETTSPSQLPPPQPPPPQVIRIEPQDYQIKDEGAKPPEDIQPPPDRNPNGKYVCNYCNLVCSKPSVLQKHIRAHTNERPYPCNSCGFSFKTRSNLYKHCRSRTHANRVMGKAQEMNSDMEVQKSSPPKSPPNSGSDLGERTGQDMRMKPYKPRFHTRFDNVAKENMEVDEDVQQEVPVNHRNHHPSSDILSHHINEIINKNNSIVNSVEFAHRYRCDSYYSPNIIEQRAASDEPLNLTTKNRKRCLSEVAEPVGPKSLIKELLLKNLYSDMQCHYCKMIFQTVTELELHKLRSCKGKPSGAKYTRSSSVNVASILTQNKNAFDNIPYLHNTVFPLNSPGPFLGKTRLVDSDKSKSFSFDDGLRSANLPALISPNELPTTPSILLSPLSFEKEKKAAIKLFGGEVKITHTTGETKSFKIGQKEGEKFEGDGSFQENRLVKSTLQSGGTVQINKTNYSKDQRVITRVYDSTVSPSPSIDIASFAKTKFSFEVEPPMIDNHLTSVSITTTAPTTIIVETPPKEKPQPLELKTPPLKSPINNHVNNHNSTSSSPTVTTSAPTPKKFPRPNSLALKPTTASLKQHHGLTPTRFNQILISPDTPRVAKKFAQHILHGNYFSYLGLKSSTRPVYCTLNKTQPFYVPHFKKLSMYSEWRQQDTKTDKLSVSAYDSRQKSGRFTQAGKAVANLITQSNYKLFVSELASSKIEKDEDQNKGPVPGGYESNEDYTYIRGRGKSRKWRGRYVCEQCGIRCKKPSMLKKHIRTHSNDRAYTCNHCNFSFKTKGNLTKHMKSKAHTKNYAASSSSSGSSTQQSGTQSSSDSDTEDSGMDSSDECIRQQEHDAAYGLLSLSQKTTQTVATNAQSDSLATSHTLAKSVATEYLKLATKNECYPDGSRDNSNFSPHGNKEVNDLIVKPEGNKSCTICAKSFSKPSQLRLHMNIHYLERPFRCDSCSVSFRTKGHLQKHERSASHHNKLSSPALSSSEPRPFKCTDCNIAFRIHGHLAKHLRSKMHIMKLECLAKIPFGLFAELERSNSLLTEINTCDGDQCLESLRTLAKKVFINDPNKLNILEADS